MSNTIEDLFHRFFKAGSPDRRSSQHKQQIRVAICHHAKNHRHSGGDDKTMDFTMMLHDGQFCYCEVKQNEGGNDGKIPWSKVSEHQQKMLDYALAHRGQALIGIGWVDDADQHIASFLLPWAEARYMQKHCLRNFLHSDSITPWATVTPDLLRDWCPHYELIPHKTSRTGRGKRIALFTQEETRAFETGVTHPNVPSHIPVPLPLEFYIDQITTEGEPTDE